MEKEKKDKTVLEDLKPGETILEAKGITKRFPGGVVANDNVNFEIKAGEIHSILGENGAGKTTLMNILYGLYHQDEGDIYVRGEKVNIDSPSDAQKLGIGMVHQHRKLIPAHTVLENIILGHPRNEKIIDKKRAKKEVKELADRYGFDVDLDAKVWQLDSGEAQIVEILKVLYRGAKLIIMDEPSSALTPRETDELVKSLKNMANEDLAVIPFITHKLPIALDISERITVLRGGKVEGTVQSSEITEEKLAKMMVGREVLFEHEKPEVEKGEEILQVENISALNDQGAEVIHDVSFSIREGEILGIAGVAGNGQSELVETIMGIRNPTNGKIIYQDEDITDVKVRDRMKRGIGYIPADRELEGSVGEFSLLENMTLNYYLEEDYCRFGFLDLEKIEDLTEEAISKFNVKCPGPSTKAKQLSGGNLQKLILARVLEKKPKVLIADLPTHGLDVSAIEFVREKILEARKEGAGILLVSKDLDEILSLSDRIAPIYEGKIQDIIPSEEATKEKVGSMMVGKSRV